MRVIEEVRRLRLEMLIEEYGSVANLNIALGKTPKDAALYHIKNQSKNSRGGAPKVMASDLARRIEKKLGKEEGWMDTDPDLWPFKRIPMEHVTGLSSEDKGYIEGVLVSALRELKSSATDTQAAKATAALPVERENLLHAPSRKRHGT